MRKTWRHTLTAHLLASLPLSVGDTATVIEGHSALLAFPEGEGIRAHPAPKKSWRFRHRQLLAAMHRRRENMAANRLHGGGRAGVARGVRRGRKFCVAARQRCAAIAPSGAKSAAAPGDVEALAAFCRHCAPTARALHCRALTLGGGSGGPHSTPALLRCCRRALPARLRHRCAQR